jgi:hypothetical protein
MQPQSHRIGRRSMAGALVVLGLFALEGHAAPVSKPAPPGSVKTERPALARTEPPKNLVFPFESAPWRKVFVWLTEETNRPFILNFCPTGTFVYYGPPGKAHSLPEVIDILNQGLNCAARGLQQFVIVNRPRGFSLMATDEKLDMAFLPRVRLEDLPQHGDTEFAVVVVSQAILDEAGLTLAEIKSSLGPLGEIAGGNGADQFVIADTVVQLRQLFRKLDDIDRERQAAGLPPKRR